MNANAASVSGTLRADETLALDERPNLPPGRVTVTVEPAADYTKTDLWKFFEKVRADQNSSDFTPRSKEEIDAEIEEGRDDHERTDLIERIQEECRRHRGESDRPPEAL